MTANDASKVYGAANPAFSDAITGYVNGDTSAVVSGSAGLTTTATSGSGIGSYTIAAATGSLNASNYSFNFVNGTLTVTRAVLTITANDQSTVYGSSLPALTASYSGFVNGDTSASLATAPTLTTTATAASPVGSYGIAVSGAVDANYSISYTGGTLTVVPATLTVTANDQGMVYGSSLPALTASYSGFVNGDTSASLATAPTLTTTATAASSVGSYGIAVSGAVDANYSITYAGGTLTVTPAALTVTANDQSKIYGSSLPTLTASYSGFVNGDTSATLATAPTLTTTATAASPVGSYGIAASGAVDANYSITYAGGTLTVTPAALTITANDQGMVYGSSLPTLTAGYRGFVNGDTSASFTTAPTLTTTATAASSVGSYGIAAAGAVDANYSITYAGGTLTVTPAALTVTANDQSMVYGSQLPALPASYSGFVNGDTSASLTTAPTLATTATAASPVGSYGIAAAGAVDANYSITYTGGTLTVTPAALTITANEASKVYGSPLPVLTAGYSGFVNGDTSASLATAPTLTTTATAASSVGSYGIAAAGAVDANYSITYAGGTLTVTLAALTITANDQGMVYGSSLPALTAGYSGFVNGDTSASLTTAPTLTTTVTAASPVGSYGIAASGAVDANYSITYAGGTLTVTPAALTVTANDQSMVYGSQLPALAASYSGFVNGDTSASLTTAPTLATTATAASPVGSYGIAAAGAVDANYSITYTGGTLTVTPAALTITANEASKVYGSPLPVLTAGYSGFVNGDTSASLATAPTLTTTATAASSVGSYGIAAAGAVDGELQHHLRGRHADGDPGRADDHGQRPGHGLWLAAAGAHGQLQRLRQWRHQRQPHDRAHADDDGYGRQPRRQLRHRGFRGRGRRTTASPTRAAR